MYYWNSNANIRKVVGLNKHSSNFAWASHLTAHFSAVTSRLRSKISWCEILRRTWTRDVEFLNLDAIPKNSTTFDKLMCWNNGDRVKNWEREHFLWATFSLPSPSYFVKVLKVARLDFLGCIIPQFERLPKISEKRYHSCTI